jgi:hypothetical protein
MSDEGRDAVRKSEELRSFLFLTVVMVIPLHTSLLLDLAHVPDAGNEVHYSLHA